MVDLDGEVVDLCRRHLPEWSAGALAHPKSRVIVADARKFILETDEQFDIIISDLPTPSGQAGGPAAALYTIEFYRRMRTRLKPGGIFAAQAGSGSLLQFQFHAALHNTLEKLFKVVCPYYAYVPSFDVPWAFLVAAQKADPRRLRAAEVDRRLTPFAKKLRFYDGQTHEGLFRVPKYLRVLLERERRVITEKK
jgi:spermidine synthase